MGRDLHHGWRIQVAMNQGAARHLDLLLITGMVPLHLPTNITVLHLHMDITVLRIL
jgi:hypothetical protein